ncbi:unnamed protein product [Ostreobium quekettii]|uniref:Dolichyl-diphosphooligosaccharide--protein glycosyltransferase 48 kDa subunit n=1 Tax=Ostreobium quekettii TaxID=121088 RepID=A0A8S1JCH1_9CHLO|nr:unnamed protein product [Ostreobium quekettii]|eukprot:evm.model.scf_44.9 EVM.evm.TU.scf_44.9   scf_44:145377-146693(+)
MHRARPLAAALALLLAASLPFPATSSKVLAILASDSIKSSHSQFFDGLASAGLDVTFKLASDPVKLRDWDTWLYDHMVIFAPRAKAFGEGVGVRDVLDFIDAGHDLLLAAGPDQSSRVSELAAECGVDLDAPGTMVHDHISFADCKLESPKGASTLVVASHAVDSGAILGRMAEGGRLKAPVVFRGVAATVPRESELVTVALTASGTAYSHGPGFQMPDPPQLIAGREVALASLMQAKNNARVAVLGSMDMFSNEFFEMAFKVWGSGEGHKQPGNREFCQRVAEWTFQRSGVLRASAPRHWEAGSKDQPATYRVDADIHFEIDIAEFKDGQWGPFESDQIQVEYVMMDPYIRKTLSHDGNGTFYADFKAPDVYGVFKFVIDYMGTGYSYLAISEQAPLRPFRHDEYERFILSAYPYYASCFSMMIGFFLLGFLYLYHK